MSQDVNEPDPAAERPQEPLPNSRVENPADLSETAPDGPNRTAPLFDKRPAVLKNPAALPEPGKHVDLAEAAFAKVTEDVGWLDKPAPSAEEQEARQERKELHKQKVRRKRRIRKLGIAAGVAAALVLVLIAVWFRYTFGGLERMPAVAGQAGADTPGENYLLIGTNPAETSPNRSPRISWKNDFANSDLVMVLHLDADKHSMYVISIPGDSALAIPDHGFGKLRDAFAIGGAPLYVRTIEETTGVRMDRVLTLDLNAFREMADILDGVIVTVPSVICDEPAGARRLDGQGALDYIALRPCMPGKDLDRVAREQSLMKALMRASVDGGTVTHPLRVNRLLRASARNTTLEDGFGIPSMFGTLWSLRHLRTSNTTFLTVPVADEPNQVIDGADYIRLDDAEGAQLWQAVRDDRVGEYLQLSGIATS